MAEIGRRNLLRATRATQHGLYLDGGELGPILLPGKYVPRDARPGDEVDVFVHLDSDDRLVATTQQPHVQAGEFAELQAVDWQPGTGAFLDWGLDKDLLLPLREMSGRVQPGDYVLIHAGVDERSGRLYASMRLDRFVDLTPPDYVEREAVKIIIAARTPLGYRAIVNGAHWGLLYASDVGAELRPGQRFDGFIKAMRPDGKIDLTLDAGGYDRIDPLAERILQRLTENGGHLPFSDKTPPEDIREAFGASKKAFKQAIGALFRDRKIMISDAGIRLA